MVRRLGSIWFDVRDEWLLKSWEADMEMWKNPRIRKALIKAIQMKNLAKHHKDLKIK